jgi:hypothetical protein
VPASAKAAKRFDRDLGLLWRYGNDIECPVAEQKLKIGPARLACAAFDNEGKLDARHSGQQPSRGLAERVRETFGVDGFSSIIWP